MAPKPRKTAKQRQDEADKITLIQAESHAQAVREAIGAPAYDMEAAAKACYEAYVRQAGLDQGTLVGGVKKLPAQWSKLKIYHRTRWRTIAQAVIEAATGVQRKKPSSA